MDFELFDHVLIIDKEVKGEIIDMTKDDKGVPYYIVESDSPGPVDDPDAYPGKWPIYTCAAEELRKI